MSNPPPTAEQIEAARKCKPHYVPPTSDYRNGWRIITPRGNEVFYDNEEDAANAAATGIY